MELDQTRRDLLLASLLMAAPLSLTRAVASPLDPAQTLRIVIPGVVCFTLGFQIILSSFFLSVLGMSRR